MNLKCLLFGHTWSTWLARGSRYDCEGEWEEWHCQRCGAVE